MHSNSEGQLKMQYSVLGVTLFKLREKCHIFWPLNNKSWEFNKSHLPRSSQTDICSWPYRLIDIQQLLEVRVT